MCEFAELPFEIQIVNQKEDDQSFLLGRGTLGWDWAGEDENLCPQDVSTHSFPTPKAMETLKSAITLIESNQARTPKCSIQMDMKPARWFTKITRGALSGDTLRKAVQRKALTHSTQPNPGNEWCHLVTEVCDVYAEHATRIHSALANEQK